MILVVQLAKDLLLASDLSVWGTEALSEMRIALSGRTGFLLADAAEFSGPTAPFGSSRSAVPKGHREGDGFGVWFLLECLSL